MKTSSEQLVKATGLEEDVLARRSSRSGGFTLIELVAVIIILAILSAAATPSMKRLAKTQSGMAASQLLRDLTFARQHAIATGQPTWVVFDVAGESWSVLAEDTANPGRANATVMNDLATGVDYTVQLGQGAYSAVTVASANFDGDTEVGFDWLGRPLNSAENDLNAQGSVALNNGFSVIVIVETGHVTKLGGS